MNTSHLPRHEYTYTPPPTPEERLAAAAPELLAALRGAQSALRKALPYLPADGEAVYAGEWLDEINEAIAKAEGKR